MTQSIRHRIDDKWRTKSLIVMSHGEKAGLDARTRIARAPYGMLSENVSGIPAVDGRSLKTEPWRIRSGEVEEASSGLPSAVVAAVGHLHQGDRQRRPCGGGPQPPLIRRSHARGALRRARAHRGFPGRGKTMLAGPPAAGRGFQRVQFTPDLLPGHHRRQRLQPAEQRIRVPAGPVFANRARRRDQPRLAEHPVRTARGWRRRQVTVDGEHPHAPASFMVIATQNPIELAGTSRCPKPSSTAS